MDKTHSQAAFYTWAINCPGKRAMDATTQSSAPERVDAPSQPQRRGFLAFLVSAPALTVAVQWGLGAQAHAASPEARIDGPDLGNVLILAGSLTAFDLVLTIAPDGGVRLELPRAEVGQGITTAAAMIVAEELDAALGDVDVVLSRARPELLFNQLTGSSNTMRSLWRPLRIVAAAARARLVTAAAHRWQLPASILATRDSTVLAPDGRRATYGSLSADAAAVHVPVVPATPKAAAQYRVIGTPTTRVDARAIVTGQARYAMDLPVAGALPTVVARAPTLNGSVQSYSDAAARLLPGVVAIVPIDSGIAVVAETFDQALKARDALQVTWRPGSLVGVSDAQIRAQLRNAVPPLVVPPLLSQYVEATFDFSFVSHAPLETLGAVADVRNGRAQIWYAGKSPIIAQETIAACLGIPLWDVTVNVVRGGGSFGRRLFFDAALEAAVISQRIGRPVKLLWTRNDDTRHGRMRPASFHRVRATHLLGAVLSYEHRMAAVRTDLGHGIGEAISAVGFAAAPALAGQGFYHLTQKIPYEFGVVTDLLHEVPLDLPTGSWRGVFSGMTGVVHEVMVDAIAARLGRDPVSFRRSRLRSTRAVAALDRVAAAGQWGRAMPARHAQGVAIWEEYGSCVAYLVEIDCTAPAAPRVTRAVVAADVGTVINPRGLEAQLMGALIDGISVTLYAGLHIDNGAVREGSFADFHYARMRQSPPRFEAHILAGADEPGGAGELGVPAAAAAVANAYARATGIPARRFPLIG
ncbi:xanthine dehydrogenase family protein molybdopterin-binding subunit [Tahibacter amnicola]|uniref:Molybdopterin-dependent oxidoreductase n=1 Tax=Tahibacter amnicola TaxID=2976241 RepID=A0ABY6BL22_9GAMM|nr:molybdopterin cofactor-binding domain-containing protein [Tahibacter amnicola]UXI70560.1 molybdopterin-dependent oxidoreductase [Tahibacter amnicola]